MALRDSKAKRVTQLCYRSEQLWEYVAARDFVLSERLLRMRLHDEERGPITAGLSRSENVALLHACTAHRA